MAPSPKVVARAKRGERVAYILVDASQVGTTLHDALIANGLVARQFSDAESFFAAIAADDPDAVLIDLPFGAAEVGDIIRTLDCLKYQGKILVASEDDVAALADLGQIGKRCGLSMLPPLKRPFRAAELKRRLGDIAARRPHRLAPSARRFDSGERGNIVVETALGHGLQSDWLELWYQPKVGMRTFAIFGAEALLRVRHPEYGVLLPGEFLPLVDDFGCEKLFRFVVERTLADWPVFSNAGGKLKISVNVPASVVAAPDFLGFLSSKLPLDPYFPGLIIEINEDEIGQERDWLRELALQLKLYNVWISIDDFGAANSSLSRLYDLPFVELKLERSFVSGCSSNPLKHGLCQTVVDLAHHLGASVCAEGVESPSDLQSLQAMGCDTAQGLLFARPMPAQQFAKLLKCGSYAFPIEQTVRLHRESLVA
jgi:EAL domain-containing protein (putative c-di-GMP-specific phosphodiesterase class I)